MLIVSDLVRFNRMSAFYLPSIENLYKKFQKSNSDEFVHLTILIQVAKTNSVYIFKLYVGYDKVIYEADK